MINVTKIADLLVDLIKKEWVAQGHHLTGKFENSLETKIIKSSDSIKFQVIDGTDEGYGKILDNGVPAENIPYTPGRGRGGTSKYIQGLINYAKLRMGAADKDAVSIAFAIANKHAKEGMPTRASSKYSSTGKRTKFVADADVKIREVLKDELFKDINKNVNNINNNT